MKLALEVIGGLILLIGGIAGFFTWAGTPPYVEHDNHQREYRTLEMEVVGGQAQFLEYQQFILRKDIRRLEQQKREMLKNPREAKEWFKFYQKDLDVLKEQQRRNTKTIKQYERRMERR